MLQLAVGLEIFQKAGTHGLRGSDGDDDGDGDSGDEEDAGRKAEAAGGGDKDGGEDELSAAAAADAAAAAAGGKDKVVPSLAPTALALAWGLPDATQALPASSASPVAPSTSISVTACIGRSLCPSGAALRERTRPSLSAAAPGGGGCGRSGGG